MVTSPRPMSSANAALRKSRICQFMSFHLSKLMIMCPLPFYIISLGKIKAFVSSTAFPAVRCSRSQRHGCREHILVLHPAVGYGGMCPFSAKKGCSGFLRLWQGGGFPFHSHITGHGFLQLLFYFKLQASCGYIVSSLEFPDSSLLSSVSSSEVMLSL